MPRNDGRMPQRIVGRTLNRESAVSVARARTRSLGALGAFLVLLAAPLGCARETVHGLSKAEVARPATGTPEGGWSSTLGGGHPLVGRIWSVRAGRFVDERDVRVALRGYVLLGEKHDNADHHALQARLLDAMVADGHAPAVAFEMLEASAQATVDVARTAPSASADALGKAVDWDASGWPPFVIYRPVFRAALATGKPLLATGLPAAQLRAIVRGEQGAKDLPEPAALDAEKSASLTAELIDAHCGHLPASHAGGMARAQRTRDATMARALRRAFEAPSPPTDVALVAGSGHTRKDRGVPLDLAALDPARPVTSVVFAEVEADRLAPGDYAARWHARALPFDFVWFTPRASDEDPCAGMR